MTQPFLPQGEIGRVLGRSRIGRFALVTGILIAGMLVTEMLVAGSSGVWPNALVRALRDRHTGYPPMLETVWLVDGPLAGGMRHLPAGPDGLPPHQFCAQVSRSMDEGGDYTMPYQRGVICEMQHAWRYTQGWTTTDIAHADIESWLT